MEEHSRYGKVVSRAKVLVGATLAMGRVTNNLPSQERGKGGREGAVAQVLLHSKFLTGN